MAEKKVRVLDKKSWIFQSPARNYLSSTTELLAFSFQAQSSYTFLNRPSVLGSKTGWANSSVSYEPSMVEARLQQAPWEGFWQSASVWWTQDQDQRFSVSGKKIKI